MVHPIICKNDVESVIVKLQDYVDSGGTIKCLNLADLADNNVVILVSDQQIAERDVKIWWSGYQAALG